MKGPTVNERERFIETLLFGNPDKVPFEPGNPRESTIKRWLSEGLTDGTKWNSEIRNIIGIEPVSSNERKQLKVIQEMIPIFEEKVIEELDDTLIVQDWKGNVCEISKTFDVTYLRIPRDFVTRRWLKCPVENREDWENMKSRYNPDDPARIPSDMKEIGESVKDRDYVMGVQFNGPFWQLREWLGFENLCMMFIDDPEFIKDMVDFWTDYVSRMLEKILPFVKLDYVYLSEDMAYKEKAMISPAMTREFLKPCYLKWNEIIKENGCPLYLMDSDGFIGELIPVWIESGINVCDPIEVAAGNDLNKLRETFGKKIAFRGGVDKRAMAKGGSFIKNEMNRIYPVIKNGGFIPSCDHGIPSDVGWKEMIEYCRILAEMTGWLK